MATATKKSALPVMNLNEKTAPALAAIAAEAQANRAQLTDLSTKEDQFKADLSNNTDALRLSEQTKGNYVGVFKITNGDCAAVQVQYKIQNTGKDRDGNAVKKGFGPDQLPTLDHFYGPTRTLLFEKTLEVTAITDALALIAEIQARGQNPMDFLDISLKKGLDRAVADSPNVTTVEMYMPKDGFLATSNELVSTWNDATKEFHNNYLGMMLKPAVTLGSK